MESDTPLIVLLGAGASVAAGDLRGRNLPPPLTVELFDEQIYGELLRRYDLAHQAGRFISNERATDDSLALEKVLHGMRTSEFLHHRQMAAAVPPYLQHLLFSVSEAHYSEAFRYDQLIERVLRLPYIFFLTLNYDLLLDRRLSAHSRLNTLEDYIEGSEKWSLIKLHGSVNWSFSQRERFKVVSPPPSVERDLSKIEAVPPDSSLEGIRGGSIDSPSRYPALAIPEGPEDELVLPSRHLWFLQDRLRSARRADLLVIGYSGLDGEALNVLRSSECEFRRMTVVNKDHLSAAKVVARFNEAGIKSIWPTIHNGSFESWIDAGGLRKLIDEYGGPYAEE